MVDNIPALVSAALGKMAAYRATIAADPELRRLEAKAQGVVAALEARGMRGDFEVGAPGVWFNTYDRYGDGQLLFRVERWADSDMMALDADVIATLLADSWTRRAKRYFEQNT